MRKYFIFMITLLITVTTKSYAESVYATLQTSAKVVLPTEVSCTDLNFGTIYVKETGAATYDQWEMDENGVLSNKITTRYKIIHSTGSSVGRCTGVPDNATLSSTNVKLASDDKGLVQAVLKYNNGIIFGSILVSNYTFTSGENNFNAAVDLIFTYE